MNEISIESFINFCDDMMIVEEAYQLPAKELFTSIANNSVFNTNANALLTSIKNC